MSDYELNWSDMAFGSKKSLKSLKPIFIAPPRQISMARFAQLIKQYLPEANIVIGVSSEQYVLGFENQTQFKMLQLKDIKEIIDKVNLSNSPHKITILNCSQSDLLSIYEKVSFKKVVLINGSWRLSFHQHPEYFAIVSNNIPIEFVSPFASEDEAINYANNYIEKSIDDKSDDISEEQMMIYANCVSVNSFDNAYQVGSLLGQKCDGGYKILAGSYNKVVPYSTFAWHYGAQRERHLSSPIDLTHYDTVHAELLSVLKCAKADIDTSGATLFINLMPCPNCARMLCETDIPEIVYSIDRSDGYAVKLLEKAGKKVRRLVINDDISDKES